MKKYLLITLMSAIFGLSSANAMNIVGLEISPEIGLVGGVTKIKNPNDETRNYGGFARVWLGAFDFVVAPQIKYDYNDELSIGKYSNTQYGLSVGYNIGLIVARLTPYIGANYSSFNKYFKDTTAFNAGLKLKIDFIPISLGVLYTFQQPEFNNTSQSQKMHSIQGLLAVHF